MFKAHGSRFVNILFVTLKILFYNLILFRTCLSSSPLFLSTWPRGSTWGLLTLIGGRRTRGRVYQAPSQLGNILTKRVKINKQPDFMEVLYIKDF
jgi:hypothetical protein